VYGLVFYIYEVAALLEREQAPVSCGDQLFLMGTNRMGCSQERHHLAFFPSPGILDTRRGDITGTLQQSWLTESHHSDECLFTSQGIPPQTRVIFRIRAR
jgi:hypothetical protein